MRLVKDQFFIEANYEDTHKLKGTSLDLYVDSDFDRYRHSVQVGVITHVPDKISPRKRDDKNGRIEWKGYFNDVPLSVGDKVYFHHFVVTKDNEYFIDGKRVYLCHMSQLFCVVKNEEIIPLEDFFFAEYIMEPEENFIKKIGSVELVLKPQRDKIKDVCKVTHIGKQAASEGIYVGQILRHLRMADYDFLCEGKERLRLSLDQVICEIKV